ncbi:heme exporter protein CcmD [Bartonella quintana]|uniref:heme exporter protein CcmD n=1 Tax=Bartonella quintana TaxID=803 RepID=UPI00031F8BA6|nr:heme exporter protein CcmD [Bartonella quintana]
MPELNSIHSGLLGNLSQKIDFFLGTLHHEQIVVLSYMLSAISLLGLIGHIVRKAIHQKKILQQLNEKELFQKEKYNENYPSKT